MLHFEARNMVQENGIPAATFKASRGWVTRFTRRHQLCIRRRMTLSQRLPQDYEEKVVEFHRFAIGLRRTKNFILSQIGNAAETPLTFDMPPNPIVSERGISTVPIKTTGCEKQRCTVMLAVKYRHS
uniref:Tigger transposase n=1 Tax=Rhipicephalus appendiculatus TaxID=34631 RepID=A0A131YAK3_RHIAP